jgi:ketosteroid isomerase-like protein
MLSGLVLLGALGALPGCAPDDTSRAASARASAEEAKVKAVVEHFFALAEKKDWDAVGDLMADDFQLYTDEATAFGKDEYVKLLKKENLDVHSWKLNDLTIRVSADGQAAWCRYRGLFSHGKSHNAETVETLVFQSGKAGWKIAHAHASVKDLGAGKKEGGAGAP